MLSRDLLPIDRNEEIDDDIDEMILSAGRKYSAVVFSQCKNPRQPHLEGSQSTG